MATNTDRAKEGREGSSDCRYIYSGQCESVRSKIKKTQIFMLQASVHELVCNKKKGGNKKIPHKIFLQS